MGLRIGITFADLVHSPGAGITFYFGTTNSRYQLPQLISLMGSLVVRASDRKAWVRCRCHQIPSKCTWSTCSLNKGVRKSCGLNHECKGTGEYRPPLQSHGKIVEVVIDGVAIYRPFGEFRRANSYSHLAVILLLPHNYINHLFSAVKRQQHLGRSLVGDFVWLAYYTLEPFQMFPDQSYSALVLRSQTREIPAFKDYFTRLDIKSNRRNPWFRGYWEHTCGVEDTHVRSVVAQSPPVSKEVRRRGGQLRVASQPLLLIREQRCPRNTTWRSATCCPSRAVLPSFTSDIDLLDSPGEVESCDNPFTNTPIKNGSVCLVSKSGKMEKIVVR
ncbi:metabotropic glutamate receptor 7 [Trichonephila clavipes]|uniref:Metabotropic glutamate receptor 7 n=1 Tax=Trichonephila clavipes TaxID=2585209 RepID=A0A8X6SQF5_TRICX|nr:metabotropic glutamate receptor 7 [Trichonephila clavipes]